MSIELNVEEHLKKFNSAPFLFVGSGFSRRYLGLEDWEGLLRKFSTNLEKDFDYYLSSAGGNLPRLAQKMAIEFHEIWWADAKYKSSREEFRGKTTDMYSPMKIEIAKYLREKHKDINNIDKQYLREIESFKKVVVDGVITTNWDLLLEDLFANNYETYIGQEELLFSNPQQIAEIYKIHGCCSNPNSMILTEDDYSSFNEKNAYLAAKLMTIFIEHPIIFIGYSMSDENIIKILTAITSCMSRDNLVKLTDRLIFLERDKNNLGEIFQAVPMVLGSNTIIVTNIRTNDYGKVYRVLSHNRRKFSAKMLRQMKSQLYELILTNDPQGKLYAVDFDSSETDLSKVEVFYGVGISNKLSEVGYKSISVNDLFDDILFGDKNFDYDKLIVDTLPNLFRLYQHIPVYKFYANSNVDYQLLDDKVKVNLQLTHDSFITNTLREKMLYVQGNYSGIQMLIDGLLEEYGIQRVLEYTTLLKLDDIDVDELRKLIIENYDLLEEGKPNNKSALRKLIRLYDWICYKEIVEEKLKSLEVAVS